MMDPYNRQPIISPLGQQYLGLVRHLGSTYGVQDPVHRDELARAILGGQLAAHRDAGQSGLPAQAQAQAPAQPPPAPARPRSLADRLDRTQPTVPMAERLEEAFREAGIGNGYFKDAGVWRDGT
jgi:hypothetical protein